MNWFQDQIEERREADLKALEESFQKIAGVVLGRRMADKLGDERIIAKQSIDQILKYYHLKPVEIPDNVKKSEDRLDYCLRHYGLMRRDIELKDKWYADAYGPILGFLKDGGTPVAMFPSMFYGYYYQDPKSGKRVRVTAKTAALLEPDAICFYRPLPLRKLGIPDLLFYLKECITVSDITLIVLATMAVSAVGLLIPRVIAALTGPILSGGRGGALIGAAICILCVSLSSQMISSANTMLTQRLDTKTSLGVGASMMMRLMSLPVSFFRQYSPGELKSRSMAVNQLCSLMQKMILNAGLTSLSSLLYVTQIFRFAPALVIPSILIILATTGFSGISTLAQIRISRLHMQHDAKESGMSYAMITGVQKIKLAGAEKRIFAKWLNIYSEGAELTYNPPTFLKINHVISTAINLFSTIILYYLSVKNGVDQSSYFAFTAAYGVLMGAFTSLSGVALSVARIQSILEMAEPFLKTPEGREIVTKISGGIELDHVSFRYNEDAPYILNDMSLKIRPGDYVAIVGRTGCGKSTLIRLLLGFETPERGAVYYDGKDVTTLDLGSLRRNIGVVTQDGGLFQGDVFSNITITAPDLTLDEAWEAAETAGIAGDIRAMPMGMYTLISEGQGGISGGQKQRLMIARAIAPKPKLLIFDEATSALDNKTQKQISESLDAMGCTRVVVAHRLSTIQHCDRIVVLEGGKIIEDGNYEELIARDGYFAELVKRQRLDAED